MSFLFVGSQICRQLPSDPPSQERPCFKLGVVIARICNLTIWMLVLLQGTFTPLVHTHAGRTQGCWSGLSENPDCEEPTLAAAQRNVMSLSIGTGQQFITSLLVFRMKLI
ncbi:hypothetical protein H6F93_11290 [Leptolyngbya sp. FACHB-671]|uniref:hypothetical protein n=1 Tax=Leptolyngbya sp. FACHB-671 TaxID=2692812 RepID=UPI001682183C|nr:hypothetical protein [Leptolyngbya sp. FACHB-671]MBD2068101.1 hypothetical protein [Leptolyngbya sp. FACHB-671]